MSKAPAKQKALKPSAATQPMFSAEKREIVPVSLDQIQFDPRQPREAGASKTANVDNIGSTLQVDAAGVAHPIHPVQLRKTPPWAEDQSKPWMTFDGECRATAAKNKGAVAIDAVEIAIAEEKVFELQVLTAMAREGLGPAAQLEAIRRFDAENPETNAANAAMRLGMKTDVVRGLRKVNTLPAEVRLRFMGGEHTLEVCDSISRIDGATVEEKVSRQEVASRAVAKMDPRKAREHIMRTYLLRLKDAPFDREDKTLIPEMGVCSACSLRTGAQASLFGSTDTGDDCCTKKSCWDEKARVTVERNPPPPEKEEPKKTGKIGKPTVEDVAVAAALAAGDDPEDLDAKFKDKTRAEIDESLMRLDAHGNPKAGPALQDRRAKGQDIGGYSRGSVFALATLVLHRVREVMGQFSASDTALFLRGILESTGGFLTFIDPGAPTDEVANPEHHVPTIESEISKELVGDYQVVERSWDPVSDDGADRDPKEEDDWAEPYNVTLPGGEP